MEDKTKFCLLTGSHLHRVYIWRSKCSPLRIHSPKNIMVKIKKSKFSFNAIRNQCLSLISAFLFISQVLLANPNTALNSYLIEPDTIPFRLTSANNLSIKAVLNKKEPVQLMFHTAASALTLTKKASERLRSVLYNQTDTVNSWGGQSAARYSADNTLQIGNFTWEEVSLWENEHSGPETDGKFGPDLFEGKVIEIDFDNSILIIHDAFPQKKGFERHNLIMENGFWFIDGFCKLDGEAVENKFLIHSGFGGALLFDDEFTEANELSELLEIKSESELRDSYGNVLKTQKAYLPALTIGKINFEKVPIGFFSGAIKRQKMSVLGGELLKRFNLIIDPKNHYIYLKANNLHKQPFPEIEKK